MSKRKLEEMGSKLDVSVGDIKKIKKENTKCKILYPIVSAFCIIFFTIYGYMIAGVLHTANIRSYYPYYGMIILPVAVTSHTKKYVFQTIVFSAVVFFLSFILSTFIFFSCSIGYNVYKR